MNIFYPFNPVQMALMTLGIYACTIFSRNFELQCSSMYLHVKIRFVTMETLNAVKLNFIGILG